MSRERLVYVGDDFDELVVEGALVHLERMDDHSIFVCISRGDAELFRGFIGASGRCKVRVFSEESECAMPRTTVASAPREGLASHSMTDDGSVTDADRGETIRHARDGRSG